MARGAAPGGTQVLAQVRHVARQLALVARGHTLVLTLGHGPQAALLALQTAGDAEPPTDLPEPPAADREGLLSTLLEQELCNLMPARVVATLITRTEVSPADPAFRAPSHAIGPLYSKAQGTRLAEQQGWILVKDGAGLRRVVAAPAPLRVLSLPAIRWLLSHGVLVVASGCGGVPVALQPVPEGGSQTLQGVAAVVDQDACSSLVARELGADCLLMLTDMPALCADWGLVTERAIGTVAPAQLAAMRFAAGSMAPKVQAVCDFVKVTDGRAAIGSIDDIQGLLDGTAGTQIRAA